MHFQVPRRTPPPAQGGSFVVAPIRWSVDMTSCPSSRSLASSSASVRRRARVAGSPTADRMQLSALSLGCCVTGTLSSTRHVLPILPSNRHPHLEEATDYRRHYIPVALCLSEVVQEQGPTASCVVVRHNASVPAKKQRLELRKIGDNT